MIALMALALFVGVLWLITSAAGVVEGQENGEEDNKKTEDPVDCTDPGNSGHPLCKGYKTPTPKPPTATPCPHHPIHCQFPTPTPVPPTPTPVPPDTPTPVPTDTPTPVPTDTPKPVPTDTPRPEPTSTNTPAPTLTPVPTGSLSASVNPITVGQTTKVTYTSSLARSKLKFSYSNYTYAVPWPNCDNSGGGPSRPPKW